jgi:CPA2 family monovalent cation:H+ antiporter-2
MHFNTVNDILLSLSVLSGIVLLIIFLFKKLHQPYTVGYILAGIIIGPHFLKIFNNTDEISMLGELGLLLHLFFMATEIEIPDSKTELLKPLIVQSLKMVLSALAAWIIGGWFQWSIQNVIILFSVLIFNSTGIVSEYLKRTGELNSTLGKTTLNVLVLQDLLFGPILIGFQIFETHSVNLLKLISSIAVCLFVFWVLWLARSRRNINIPRLKEMENDHELQVFFGFVIC